MKGRSSLLSGISRSVLVGLLVLCISSCIALIGGGNTAQASETNPTLTLHLLKAQHEQEGQNSILPGKANSPAGAGYIYQAIKLDASKIRVEAAKLKSEPSSMQERLTSIVVARQAEYKDASGLVFYGVSDANGVITTSKNQTEGVWLKGASLNTANSSLSGGSPAVFDGTIAATSYWLVSLVGSPQGVTVRTDPCVIQLPTLSSSEEASLFNVDVYPKLDIQESQVRPTKVDKTAQGQEKLAKSGSSVLAPLVLMGILLSAGLATSLMVRSVKKKN